MGDFAAIETKLALPKDARPDRAVQEQAESFARQWFRERERQFRRKFNRLWALADFRSWLDLEIDFIWKSHAEAQRGLFNMSWIPEMARLLKVSESKLRELHGISLDQEALNSLVERRDPKTFGALCRAYVGAFLLRTSYHYWFGRLSGNTVVPHVLRREPEFLPEYGARGTPFEHNQTIEHLAKLILWGSRQVKEEKRAKTYAEHVDAARKGYDLIDTSPKRDAKFSELAAIKAAKDFDVPTRGRSPFKVLGGVIGAGIGLVGFLLIPFVCSPRTIVDAARTGVRVGDAAGRWMLNTEARYKNILERPPGLVVGKWR